VVGDLAERRAREELRLEVPRADGDVAELVEDDALPDALEVALRYLAAGGRLCGGWVE
jgi:hypothetical protein